MSDLEKVYESIKRKKSNAAEAARLRMSIEEYVFLKREALQKNSSDSMRLEALSDEEPKTAEEIIRLLKIDTTKWKLSQFWNKQKENKWVVSALVTQLPAAVKTENSFLDRLALHNVPLIKPNPVNFYDQHDEDVCGVLSLQDLHIGKRGNENIAEIVQKSLEYLLLKGASSYNLKQLILVVGPDMLNMDTFGGATTLGTITENSSTAVDAYIQAYDILVNTIMTTKNYCEHLHILFIAGNHDRLTSFHLLHACSKAFDSWMDISFDVDYSERKVIKYGKNFIGFEHGDVPVKNNPLVYAVEYPEIWGQTTHRILYTGHYHSRKTKEIVTENEQNGFVTRTLPALTAGDYWHYHHKYVGSTRSAILHIHDYNNGLIAEFACNC